MVKIMDKTQPSNTILFCCRWQTISIKKMSATLLKSAYPYKNYPNE